MDYEAKYFIYSYIYLVVTLLDLLLFDFHPLSCVAVSTHSRLLSDKSATKGNFLKIPGLFLPPLQSQKVPAADSPSAFQDISSTWMWNKQMPPGCSSQKGFGVRIDLVRTKLTTLLPICPNMDMSQPFSLSPEWRRSHHPGFWFRLWRRCNKLQK